MNTFYNQKTNVLQYNNSDVKASLEFLNPSKIGTNNKYMKDKNTHDMIREE